MPREQPPQIVVPGRMPAEGVSLDRIEAIPAGSLLGQGDEASGTPQAITAGNGLVVRNGFITATGRRWSWLMGD